MGLYPVAGAGSEIWQRKAGPTDRAGATPFGQRHLLRGSFRLCVETLARRFWSLANRLWLFSMLEPGLDMDVHSRHGAGLAAPDRKRQSGPDRRDHCQSIG